jgi:hypothetical protein
MSKASEKGINMQILDLKNDLDNNEINNIIKEGRSIEYLQNFSKKILIDLKEFNDNSNSLISSMIEKFQFEFKNILQFSSEYKQKIDSLISNDSERNKKMEILKVLRNQVFPSQQKN